MPPAIALNHGPASKKQQKKSQSPILLFLAGAHCWPASFEHVDFFRKTYQTSQWVHAKSLGFVGLGILSSSSSSSSSSAIFSGGYSSRKDSLASSVFLQFLWLTLF